MTTLSSKMRVIYFLLLVHRTLCQDYSQTRTLLSGDLVLHYTVEDHKFKFKLEGRADQQIGLAFSYHVSIMRAEEMLSFCFSQLPRMGLSLSSPLTTGSFWWT